MADWWLVIAAAPDFADEPLALDLAEVFEEERDLPDVDLADFAPLRDLLLVAVGISPLAYRTKPLTSMKLVLIHTIK